MAKQYILKEDKRPPNLPVVYSDDVINEIKNIKEYNQFEKDGLSRLFSYIKGIENHISNRAIAFGYGNNYARNADETTYVYDFGVTFRIVDDTDRTFVEITWMDLNLEEFGLKLWENRKINISRIITETIDDYLSKNLLYEKENKLLTDEEIMDKLSKLVSDLHVKGKLTQKESDKILFYGLYNNKHFQNGGRRSL